MTPSSSVLPWVLVSFLRAGPCSLNLTNAFIQLALTEECARRVSQPGELEQVSKQFQRHKHRRVILRGVFVCVQVSVCVRVGEKGEATSSV